MKKNVQTTLILALLYTLSISFGHAFDIDETVDDEIRKNYNPTQLINDVNIKETALDKNIQHTPSAQKQSSEESLPALPNITKVNSSSKESDVKNNSITSNSSLKPYIAGNIKVKAGTVFNVVSESSISDWQRKGTKVNFRTVSNAYGNGYTIPKGTIFHGEILDSHQPQITCNGGLVVVKIYSMNYKGMNVPLSAYVSRVNDKKIFLNNIKGKRTFLKTTWEKGDWGRSVFNKMLAVTVGLGADGSTLILTPFPVAYGTICLGLNTITSPICAFFSKGEHISLPSGSRFRIKLVDEVLID